MTRLILLAILGLTSGCSLDRDHRDHVVFWLPSKKANPPLPVSVVDARPRWERRSDGDLAVQFLSAESLEPPIWVRFESAISDGVSEWPEAPTAGILTVHALRFVTHDLERREREEQLEERTALDRYLALSQETDDPPADTPPVNDIVSGALCSTAHELLRNGRTFIFPCPYRVNPDVYPEGASCELVGELEFLWPEQRSHVVELNIREHNCAGTQDDEVPAMEQAVDAMLGRVGELIRASEPGSEPSASDPESLPAPNATVKPRPRKRTFLVRGNYGSRLTQLLPDGQVSRPRLP